MNCQAALRAHLRLVIINLKVNPGQDGHPLLQGRCRGNEELDLTMEYKPGRKGCQQDRAEEAVYYFASVLALPCTNVNYIVYLPNI